MQVDFTSSLYLGLEHPSAGLQSWSRLTTGAPASLGEPPLARRVAGELARLVGCEAAMVATSTLHIAWDLSEWIVSLGAGVVVDDGAYPTLRVAARLAKTRGATIRSIRRHDPHALREAIGRLGGVAIVIADGFCTECGRAAPLTEYADIVGDAGGYLVVDDTQALGILGTRPSAAHPYGIGGGGTLARLGVARERVVFVASLAKGFGAPLAAVAGPRTILQQIEHASPTRVHCSPPSVAALAAAARSLAISRSHGERLRTQLWNAVRYFRDRMTAAGLRLGPGMFPLQTLLHPRGDDAVTLFRTLHARGVRAVLSDSSEGHGRSRARLTFVLTARHTAAELQYAVSAIGSTQPSPVPRLSAEALWLPR